MMRHSAIAYADDDPCIPNIAFAGDAWLRYIPIRMPDTLTVTEGVPAGITAILINRAHAQNDICLPIRAHEMRLLEGVDGTRTIGELFLRRNASERWLARCSSGYGGTTRSYSMPVRSHVASRRPCLPIAITQGLIDTTAKRLLSPLHHPRRA